MPTVDNSVTITRTYQRPVTHREKLGSLPLDRFEATRLPVHGLGSIEHSDNSNAGFVPVYRQVPDYNEDGTPKTAATTETLSAKPFSPTKRAVTSGVLAGAAALLVAGTGPAGWVIAGVASAGGALWGKKSAEADEVKEKWVHKAIEHPKMEGHDHITVPVPYVRRNQETHKREVGLAGYAHLYEPDIKVKKVGEYDKPTLEHKRAIDGKTSAVLAAGAGLAFGGLIHLFTRKGD